MSPIERFSKKVIEEKKSDVSNTPPTLQVVTKSHRVARIIFAMVIVDLVIFLFTMAIFFGLRIFGS